MKSGRLIQINTVAASGSVGRIADGIGDLAIASGWESWIAYGRNHPRSRSGLIRIGSKADSWRHGLITRLLDRHGLGSAGPTKEFLRRLDHLKPDLIHLHNIHGYYLNYPRLFDWLCSWGGPVVWTFHDCWPITGHCVHFDFASCGRWKSSCHDCPEKNSYPASLFADRSRRNHDDKKRAFSKIKDQLTLVCVSDWLSRTVRDSFLGDSRILTIRNGIDTRVFSPVAPKKKNMILGVANVWDKRKGLDDFVRLRELLPQDFKIVLAGLTPAQIKSLPDGIRGMGRTESARELAALYSEASVFVNPSKEETLSMTNIEALACGTPVVCYDSGGMPETLGPDTGRIVARGDIYALRDATVEISHLGSEKLSGICRLHATRHFDRNERFKDYIDLYNDILSGSHSRAHIRE